MPSIHLTNEEIKLFKHASASLRSEVDVTEERLGFSDSPEQYAMRLRNLHLTHKPLTDAMKKATSIKSAGDLFALSSSVDFSQVPEKDMLEVYYLMGPQVFTDTLNMMLLKGINSPDDLAVFVSNALIRHELLVSMNLPPKY